METYQFDHLVITLGKEGSKEFSKVSFPVRYGRFSEVITPDYLFQFNLNGEIKYIQGRGESWPHLVEWLKRTGGNDWIYYSAGDYKDIYAYFGEYYFPCLSYPSNAIIGNNLFGGDAVNSAMKSWQWLRVKINELTPEMKPRSLKDFLTRIVKTDEEALRLRSDQLHDLLSCPGRPVR